MEVLAPWGLFGFEIQANNPIGHCYHFSQNFKKRRQGRKNPRETESQSLVFGEAVFEPAMIAVGKSFGIS